MTHLDRGQKGNRQVHRTNNHLIYGPSRRNLQTRDVCGGRVGIVTHPAVHRSVYPNLPPPPNVRALCPYRRRML